MPRTASRGRIGGVYVPSIYRGKANSHDAAASSPAAARAPTMGAAQRELGVDEACRERRTARRGRKVNRV